MSEPVAWAAKGEHGEFKRDADGRVLTYTEEDLRLDAELPGDLRDEFIPLGPLANLSTPERPSREALMELYEAASADLVSSRHQWSARLLAAWQRCEREAGATCKDEGCPHYGTAHGHGEARGGDQA